MSHQDSLQDHDRDPVVTDPDKYRVVFENDRVRVLEYLDAPGARTSPHAHPDSVMVTLSGFRRRLHHEGGTRDVELRPVWRPGCRPSSTAGRTSATARPTRSSSS